ATALLTRLFVFFFSCHVAPPALHSFPTRRSSDLLAGLQRGQEIARRFLAHPLELDQLLLSERVQVGDVGDQALLHQRRREGRARSEEHTSELQSRENLVCRLLLEKKKNKDTTR